MNSERPVECPYREFKFLTMMVGDDAECIALLTQVDAGVSQGKPQGDSGVVLGSLWIFLSAFGSG